MDIMAQFFACFTQKLAPARKNQHRLVGTVGTFLQLCFPKGFSFFFSSWIQEANWMVVDWKRFEDVWNLMGFHHHSVLFWYYEFPGNLQRRQFQSHLFSFLFSFISWEQRQENGDHTGLTGGFASVDGSAEGEKERVRIFMMRGKRRGGHGQDFYDEDQLWEKGVDQCFQSSRNILSRMRMMRGKKQDEDDEEPAAGASDMSS